jgi:hypothetical protein
VQVRGAAAPGDIRVAAVGGVAGRARGGHHAEPDAAAQGGGGGGEAAQDAAAHRVQAQRPRRARRGRVRRLPLGPLARPGRMYGPHFNQASNDTGLEKRGRGPACV